MRILRGKSNLEVSSHGFALFVVGLILATFVGGAVRTLLASDRVHQRIVSELRNRFPNQDIKIGPTEVLLSRGIWPALGLKVSGVSFTQETCGRLSFTIDVPLAVLPIDVWSLKSGRARLGEVELVGGQLHLDYKPCEAPTGSASTSPEAGLKIPPADGDAATSPSATQWKPPRFEWKERGRALDGVELRDFSVTYENKPDWKLHVRHATLDFTEEFLGRASVEVQKSLPFGSVTHLVEMDAQSDNSVLQWQVNSEFKEGRVAWKGSWDTKSHSAQSQIEISQFPIREVLAELYQMGLMDRQVEMKTTWINCLANWDGSLEHPGEAPLHVHQCKIEGAYGGIQMEKADLFPLQGELLRVPVNVKVSALQVQPIVEALNRQVLPTVINKLGVWSGEVRYLNKHNWKLNGSLAGSEIVFSNQSVRGKQAFRSVGTTAEKAQGLIAAKIDRVEMNDGQFDGLVDFSLNEDWRSGTFRASINNLTLSPGIQSLLFGGTWTALKINGSGTLLNGDLSEWKGTVEAPHLGGEGWSGDKLQIQSRYSPGVFTLDSHLVRMEMDAQWKYFPTVKERVAPTANRVGLKDVRSKVEVRNSGGEILSFTAIDEVTGRTWRGRGSWQRDRDLVAVLSGNVGGRQKNFTLRAEKGLLSIDEQAPAAAR